MTQTSVSNYELVDYDVWGNAEDGYDVNDAYKTGEIITMTNDATDTDIIEYLKNIGYLNDKANSENIYIDSVDYEFAIEIFEADTMKPIGRLEAVI